VLAAVLASVLSAIVVAVLAGAGLFDKAESVGDGIVSRRTLVSVASPTSELVASEPPVPGRVRVEVGEALDALDAYSNAAGRRDYAAAYARLTPARQEAWSREAFDRFWNGIARTGFFPDPQPSADDAVWRDDGSVVITVTLFFDVCAQQTRSVEHVQIVVERHGSALRLGDYSPTQDPELTGAVPPDVPATCPP
jgi:hypothetical protein